MGFFDGLGQIAGLAGSAGIANPTISAGLTGLGAISSLFGGPSAAEQAAAQARREAQGFYSNADTAANYYQNQAATGKAQQDLYALKFQDAANEAIAARTGYSAYSPNQSQNRADRLQTAYNTTDNAANNQYAFTKANLESRGMDPGSSVGAGLAAYNDKNTMAQKSSYVLGLNQQMRDETIQNADYAAQSYGNRYFDGRQQATSNTQDQIQYDQNRAGGLMGQSMYNQSIAQNEAYQKNQYLGQIGGQIGQELHRNYQAPKSAGAGMNGPINGINVPYQGQYPTVGYNDPRALSLNGSPYSNYGMGGGMGGGVYGMGGGVYGMGGGMGGGVYGMGGGVYGMGGGMRGGSGMGGGGVYSGSSMSPSQMSANFSHYTTGIAPVGFNHSSISSGGGNFGTGSQQTSGSSGLGNFGTGIPPAPPPSAAY